jgi:ferritin-like metal-binding protein YciE
MKTAAATHQRVDLGMVAGSNSHRKASSCIATESICFNFLSFGSDASVKIVLANYAAEHFEIACYRSLQTAAELAGLPHIVEFGHGAFS